VALFRKPEPPLDPFERAARRVDPEYARLAEAADAVPPKSLRATRLLLLFAALVGLVAITQTGRGTSDLRRSCTAPAVDVSPSEAAYDAPVHWAVTGPSDLRVVLALDETQVPTTPLAGPVPLKDCLVRGSFPLQAATGKHRLTFFLLRPDGTVARQLVKPLTVS
jgi:hypothetical protein